jgi:putative membrane protein insertion efficiency factor
MREARVTGVPAGIDAVVDRNRRSSLGSWNAIMKILTAIGRAPGELLILMVRGYQITLSPLLGRHCRFEPSCSHYFIGSVRKYGAVRGALRGMRRIAKCHPFHPGGYDPP